MRLSGWIMLGAAMLALSGGCNNKIKKYADQINAMSVDQQNTAGPPQVSLGRIAAPVEDAAATGAATAGNMVIEVFEVQLITRLSGLVSPGELAKVSRETATNAMNSSGPYPVDESSRWRLVLTTTGWGISADVDQPASAWISIDASAYGPKGKRIWRRSVSCSRDLSGYMPSGMATTQTAVNIGMVTGMSDADLLAVYDDVARQCGQDVASRLNSTIQRAKSK